MSTKKHADTTLKKREPWPRIKKIILRNEERYMLDCRISGKGERFYFSTRAEAEGEQLVQRTRRANSGAKAVHDDELAAYGWSVQRAIDFALTHLRQQNGSKDISEAVAALVAAKKGKVGDIRLADITNRLARFAEFCKGKTLRQIDGDSVNAFLDSIPHPATRNDYRKEIVLLWHFAKAKPREWVAASFDKHEVPRAAEPDKARIILTIAQAQKLMEASVDADILALNAMVLFGGLRREEVEKLDWSAVDFRTGHIRVTAEISKVSRERFAPMTDNLRAWLKPIAKKSGPIVSRILMHALRDTWKRAGIYPWPQDAHRHSFISYRRRIIGDAQTALDAGTSETIIKKHYQRPVMKEDAEEYFRIMPRAGKK